MPWSPCSENNHYWKPIPNWHGRYECDRCKSIGHKPAVTAPWRTATAAIVPYVCSKCKGPRTDYKDKRCPNCR